jgi:hypothetical protein
MEIIVVSDIHYARVWDEIEKILPPEIEYHNPNILFRLLLSGLNKEQKLIVNGDLIDCYYADYEKGDETNLELFFQDLKKSPAEYFLNLGNHEYRRRPYNFIPFGLGHVLISRTNQRKYLSKVHTKFRYLKDFGSLTVRLSKHNPVKLPEFDNYYSKVFGDSTYLIMNTGPELVFSPRYFLRPKYWKWIFSKHPALRGLSLNQIKFTQQSLESAKTDEVVICMHAPPFFSAGHFEPFKLDESTYYFDIIRHGVSYCYFVKNNWEFINLIMNSQRNIIVITSHTHIPKQYIISKKKRMLSESTMEEINQKRSDSNYIKFISTPALGAAHSKSEGGYVKLSDTAISYEYLPTPDRKKNQAS